MEKTMEIYQIYSFRTLIYYGKNYGTMEKTMVLWKKIWYYTENYGTVIYYGKNYGTMEKTMVQITLVYYSIFLLGQSCFLACKLTI